MADAHHSSIPAAAVERVTEHPLSGHPRRAAYLHGGQVVGVRALHPGGAPCRADGLRGGRRHGLADPWDAPGALTWAVPDADGLEHATARPWAADGRSLGTSLMEHGPGLALRWQEVDGRACLAAARHLTGGVPDGVAWWLDEGGGRRAEGHGRAGERHGPERAWHGRGAARGRP